MRCALESNNDRKMRNVESSTGITPDRPRGMKVVLCLTTAHTERLSSVGSVSHQVGGQYPLVCLFGNYIIKYIYFFDKVQKGIIRY